MREKEAALGTCIQCRSGGVVQIKKIEVRWTDSWRIVVHYPKLLKGWFSFGYERLIIVIY